MKNNFQQISRKDLYAIYKSDICAGWKDRVVAELAEQSGDTIDVSNDDIKKAYSEANTSQKKLLEKYFDIKSANSIMKGIKTFDDVLKALGRTLDEVLPWKFPKNKAQISQNAIAKIQCITELYNDGTELDWRNSNQSKYYPWFQKNAHGRWVLDGVHCNDSAARLGFGSYFKSRELAQDAVDKFTDIWIEALPE